MRAQTIDASEIMETGLNRKGPVSQRRDFMAVEDLTKDDRIGLRLDELELAVQQFRQQHEDGSSHTSVHTHATGRNGLDYTEHILSIMERQHKLLVMLDSKLNELEAQGR